MIPYGDVLQFVVIWLTARHYYKSRASFRSKRIAVYLRVHSTLCGRLLPTTAPAVALFQLAICVYVILCTQPIVPEDPAAPVRIPQEPGPPLGMTKPTRRG